MKTTVVYVMFIHKQQCQFKSICVSPNNSHLSDWKKNQQMVSNVFVADQAVQLYIYLIIYLCVGNYGSRC